MGDGRRLRPPVSLDESPTSRRFELLAHLVRKGRGAGDAAADRTEVVLRELRVPEDRDVHRRDAAEETLLRLVDQLEDRADLSRVRVQDVLAPRDDGEE